MFNLKKYSTHIFVSSLLSNFVPSTIVPIIPYIKKSRLNLR